MQCQSMACVKPPHQGVDSPGAKVRLTLGTLILDDKGGEENTVGGQIHRDTVQSTASNHNENAWSLFLVFSLFKANFSECAWAGRMYTRTHTHTHRHTHTHTHTHACVRE